MCRFRLNYLNKRKDGGCSISKNSSDKTKINDAISASKVRLIDEDGKNKGCVDLSDALSRAEEAELDLVQLTNESEPVCRVMDYGKYRYTIIKKTQNARRLQKAGEVKEIKLSLGIGDNDYQVKLRAVRAFIESAKKVKVTLRFRGREVTHSDLGFRMFERFTNDITDLAKQESPPRLEGNMLRMTFAHR